MAAQENKSERIRELARKGYAVGDIAKLMKIRYQYAYQVLRNAGMIQPKVSKDELNDPDTTHRPSPVQRTTVTPSEAEQLATLQTDKQGVEQTLRHFADPSQPPGRERRNQVYIPLVWHGDRHAKMGKEGGLLYKQEAEGVSGWPMPDIETLARRDRRLQIRMYSQGLKTLRLYSSVEERNGQLPPGYYLCHDRFGNIVAVHRTRLTKEQYAELVHRGVKPYEDKPLHAPGQPEKGDR